MQKKFLDSHAHLTSDEVYPLIDDVLARAQKAHVDRIINICTDAPTMERGLILKEKYPWIENVGATTPHDVEKEGEKNFPLFEKMAREGHLVAVGETGLDYYYEHSNRELQVQFLEKYLELATDTNLPVVIHCRDAFDDLFSICKSFHGKLLLHCFTGDMPIAEKALERGWLISLSGIVTFKRSESLREVAKSVPLSHLVIETDSPYLAPQSKRGKQNEPAYVVETAETLAASKNISLEEVAIATYENACQFFKLRE